MAHLQVLANMKANIEKIVAEVQQIQTDHQTAIQSKNQLQSQFTENKMVKEELDQLEDDASIYKLVGPVLIPQEPEEAKSTVSTRMSFISKELRSATEKAEKIEKLQQEKQVLLLSEQQKFRSLAQQAASSFQQPQPASSSK